MRTEIAMSNHNWTQENLDAYLAGGLTADERSSVELHIEACAECAQTLEESRKLEQLMDDLFIEARPDAALEERAIAKLRGARITRASAMRFIAAAAAVLVLGLIGAAVQAIAEAGLPLKLGIPVAQNNIKQTGVDALFDVSESMDGRHDLGRDSDIAAHYQKGLKGIGGREDADGLAESYSTKEKLAFSPDGKRLASGAGGPWASANDESKRGAFVDQDKSRQIPPGNSPPGVVYNYTKRGEKVEGEALRKHGHTLGMELHNGDTSIGKWKASTESTW